MDVDVVHASKGKWTCDALLAGLGSNWERPSKTREVQEVNDIENTNVQQVRTGMSLERGVMTNYKETSFGRECFPFTLLKRMNPTDCVYSRLHVFTCSIHP